MKLHDLKPAEGAGKRRKRVGRGIAAGQGKTAGRGQKGQNARSGGGVKPYFEGGQLPLVRKLPFVRGVGFRDPWRVEFTPVNVERLTGFRKGTEVTPEMLAEVGVIKSADELAWLTGLPVLGSIARIVTPEDVARKKHRRRLILALAGLSLLAGVFIFHFFVMDLWVLAAKLDRFTGKYL